MSDTTNAVAPTKQASLKDIEAVRDLFARAHDYIAQASHPGHMGMKVAEVLNFLGFQYNDFKLRAENLAKQIEADAKAELSKVDVEAAKNAVDAVLSDNKAASPASMSDEHGSIDAPKA
jgi:hypothetical protein